MAYSTATSLLLLLGVTRTFTCHFRLGVGLRSVLLASVSPARQGPLPLFRRCLITHGQAEGVEMGTCAQEAQANTHIRTHLVSLFSSFFYFLFFINPPAGQIILFHTKSFHTVSRGRDVSIAVPPAPLHCLTLTLLYYFHRHISHLCRIKKGSQVP